MAQELSHDSLQPQRARDLMPERVFAFLWQEMQVPQQAIDYGFAALELILNTRPLREGPPAETLRDKRLQNEIDPVSQRDATVAATIIQWLGTDQGACFIQEAEKRIAIERQRLNTLHHQTNNLGCQKCGNFGTIKPTGFGQHEYAMWNLFRCSYCDQQYAQGVIPDSETLDVSVIYLDK